MKEAFLHFVWQHGHYASFDLKTDDGDELEIVHAGVHNHDAGPDFFQAQLRIGDTLWVGNIEVHLRSSDWTRHSHQEDPLYSNCILHVVWENDAEVAGLDGRLIPTLSLHDKVDKNLLYRYQSLIGKHDEIACASHFQRSDEFTRNFWMERMMVERLERRSAAIQRLLEGTTWHWEEAFYQALARNFGFHINADAFERLARSISLPTLLRLRDRLFSLEALLFGQAGFLDKEFQDEYPRRLRDEYLFQCHRLRIRPLLNPGWKFLRLRPSNFPTLRIAQFASLLHRHAPVFQQCMEAETLEELLDVFDVGVSAYWQTHLRPDVTTVPGPHRMGSHALQLLVINTVVPFLFLRGKRTADPSLCERSIQWLQQLSPEKNRIVNAWESIGWKPNHAGESQGLLHLYQEYCSPKKCIHCRIGNSIIINHE